jgi:hypothetical protein
LNFNRYHELATLEKEIMMREYKITFHPIDPSEAPAGPITVVAQWLDEAIDLAVERLKVDYPDRSHDLNDYKPRPHATWRELLE